MYGPDIPNYTVSIDSLMDDVRIWRVVMNGYPYKTPAEMGVENTDDAFVATKQAIYRIIDGQDPSTLYNGADERGRKIKDAIVRLVDIGRNGTETPADAQVSVNAQGDFVQDSNSNYYSQTYSVSSAVDMSTYTVTNIAGFPEGTVVTDVNNNPKTTFNGGENFKILVLKDKLTTDIDGIVSVQAKCKTYPVFYGKTPNEAWQNYLVTFDPYGDHSGVATLNVKAEGRFSLEKLSADNNIWTGNVVGSPVPGAEYTIKNSAGDVVKTVITNSEGKAQITLPVGHYTIQETKSADKFKIDTNVYEFDITFRGESQLSVNEEAEEGGYLSLKKVSGGNNLWTGHIEGDPVAGATYRIESLDKDWHIDVTTNENGEVVDSDFTSDDIELSLGNYKCYEISAPEGFKLNEEETYFTLDKNEEYVELTLKDIPEEGGNVQVTKTAADYNYKNGVKEGEPVVGAIYKIYNAETDEEVATLETTVDGTTNIVTLGLGDYYIKEVWVSEEWILNEEPVYFSIEKNEDNKYFNFTNEPETTGFLNINKTVLEDNTLNGDPEGMPLEGVTFELRDEEDNVLMTLVTDENGHFSEDIMLDAGTYYLWETDCPPYYVKKETPDVFEITKNGQKVIIDIKNQPAEADLDVEKSGIIQAQPNDEIRYDFNTVANNSNVPVDNFTMTDNLPYDYIELKKLFTGIYSDEVTFDVWYKTNLTDDYVLFKEDFNSKINNYIDFEEIDLKEGEYITDFKMTFGTVPAGFKAETTPFMFAQVRSSVKGDDKWTNNVSLTATYLDVPLEDRDDWTTISYEKKLEIKKLPRTGM